MVFGLWGRLCGLKTLANAGVGWVKTGGILISMGKEEPQGPAVTAPSPPHPTPGPLGRERSDFRGRVTGSATILLGPSHLGSLGLHFLGDGD